MSKILTVLIITLVFVAVVMWLYENPVIETDEKETPNVLISFLNSGVLGVITLMLFLFLGIAYVVLQSDAMFH
ncbi:MAG: hypothetical protein ABIG20_04400 [archaeon]